MDLKGSVALVTGAATGLGRSLCEELLKRGACVSICDLDSDAGENACDELGKKFGKEKVLFCHCDVTDYVQFDEAFQTTLAEFDNIDIVINNAEIMNDKFWELEVDVNLNGTIRGTLLALQFLGKDKGGKGGCIINIGSAASIKPQISTPIYTATKHAILGLSKSCGDNYHFKHTGVKVIAACVGPLDTGATAPSNRFKSPIHEKAWQFDMKGFVPQKTELASKGIVSLIKEANSGTIWTVTNNSAPKEIPYSAGSI
ncbi:15-hydroxyprostaglandin dehydrogenase [NAD(+)]-like [Condylostylus longicornis]|uniref:15-hydroxyprostaglandin dehydrogenase [NAD(+)]-like n=1 Tax=Condylostylus longicornis TaxID=2530218 RepID=UPI00244E496C|nr:15-hydroxyprostaglandin dehydrogenase [NAD(+)]-like [Condylostylus longicornis]